MGTMTNSSWYRVVWEGYNNNVRDLLSEAWHSRFHTDLTIVAENQVIKCHRMVLARNIRYFREMLSQDFIDDKPVIVAVLAPYELVNAIITFTYLGEVNVVKSNLQPLMKLADELGVNGLMNSSTMNPQQSHYTQASSSVLCAAEALQNLGKAPRVADHTSYKLQQGFAIDYHVVPKHPSTHVVSNQPSTGEQPPTAQQDQVDFQSLRYKAAASRKSASRSPPPCSSPSDMKRRRLSQTTSIRSAASPDHRNPSPSTSGSSYHLQTKQEDPDSEDSDRELQIDEGIDQPSPMEYCDEQMYVEETEPQDLRVEARQHLTHSSDAAVCISSSPLQSHLTSESMYLPSSVAVFPSTAASDMLYDSTTTESHFLSSSLGEVTVHTVPKKRPNGIALSVLNSSNNGNGNFVTLTHQLTNSHARKNSLTPTSTSSKDGGFVQVNINNNETNATSNNSPHGSGNGKMLGGGSGGKSNEKSYSFDQLTAAVEVVVKGQAQPVEAINQYSIPRRTFFRHLKNRRTELGIESKTRSKPSSRATSPSSGSPNSSSSSGSSATPNLSNNFHQHHNHHHHHHIPASGTQLHAMLKSISTAHQKVPPPQSMNNNIVKQEPEDSTHFTNEEEGSSSADEKDKVFALLKQSVQMNLKQATCSKSSDRN